MLDTLMLNLNTLQHFSENIEPKTRQASQNSLLTGSMSSRKRVADAIEVICDKIDDLVGNIENNWNFVSDECEEQLRDIRPSLEKALEIQKGWSGFLFSLSLLPESIRRKKDLNRCLMRSLSRLERAISDRIARESIRVGWKEVMTGKTIPLSELWDGLDSD